MPHRYRVELVRDHPNVFRCKEEIDVSKTFDTYKEAYAYMELLGGDRLSLKIRFDRNEFKPRDKRYKVIRIIIEP